MGGTNVKTVDVFTLLQNEDRNQLGKVARFYDASNNLTDEFKAFPKSVIGDACLGRSFQYDGNNNVTGTTSFVTQWTSVYEALSTAPITDILLDNDSILPSQPAGTLVGSFTPVGGVGPFTFGLISNPGNLFELQNNNELYTTSSLGLGSYPITVLVTDSVGQFFTKNFNIQVVNYLNEKALVFNGVDTYVNYGTTADVQFDTADTFSISCWVRRITTTGTDIIFGNNGSGTNLNNQGVVLHFDTNANNRFLVHLNNSGANQIRIRSEFGSGTVDNYIHVVMTYDGSGTAAGTKIYLNGAVTTPTVLEDGLAGQSIQSANNWTSGAKDGGALPFLGFIDEPTFWNKELSAAEVTELYNSGEPNDPAVHSANANLIHSWRNGDKYVASSLTITDQTASLDGSMINMDDDNVVGVVP